MIRLIPKKKLEKVLLANPYYAYLSNFYAVFNIYKGNINGLGIYGNGNKYWFKNGNLHRDDGPAIETSNGWREWWLNGKRMRVMQVPF